MEKIRNRTKELLKNSYGVYSKVFVSSLIETEIGNFEGVNVENPAFGETICAEKNAILNAVTNGMKPGQLKKVHINSSVKGFLPPCGSCRQVISEFVNENTSIVLHDSDKNKSIEILFIDLFPYTVNKKSFDVFE
ncbi:MAG: cytidine deaminase [Mollicutes bacterium PWAP]|nr:cytidine deaminase [Mollicutes bacterium PWAP]